MAILTINTNTEFYLFMNGELIYKRWLKTGQSFIFDINAYTKNTLVSIKSSCPKWDLQMALEEWFGTYHSKARRNFKLFDDEGGVFKISETRIK